MNPFDSRVLYTEAVAFRSRGINADRGHARRLMIMMMIEISLWKG
jgi:hypothetical protein